MAGIPGKKPLCATRPNCASEIMHTSAFWAPACTRATGGPPAKSLTARPLGLYARPPRQNFRRRGPARPRNRNFALRRFHVGRPSAARSGRPGPPICSRGLRYRSQGWCECEKNRLHAYIFMGRGASAKHPDRGAASRAKSAGPIVAPTGRSAIISPEATSTGRSAPRVEVFSTDTRTLFAQPNRPITSPLRRLGPSPWDPGPGAGRIDRP